MITWVLIVSYWMGNATFQYAITNIETETECHRVGAAIPKPPTNIHHYSQTCIKVKSAKSS